MAGYNGGNKDCKHCKETQTDVHVLHCAQNFLVLTYHDNLLIAVFDIHDIFIFVLACVAKKAFPSKKHKARNANNDHTQEYDQGYF
jgi:hypothetical protein